MKKFILLFVIIITLFFAVNCSKPKAQISPEEYKPGTVEYYLNQGIFYLNNGKFDQAEKSFIMGYQKNSNHIGVLNGLGIINLNRREFDKAEIYFMKIIKINPGFTDAYNSLGIIYIEKGDYEKAKENLLIAANTDDYQTPENAFFNLANLEMKSNKIDSALRYVEKGLAFNKYFSPLYNVKGLILEFKQNYKEALYNYERAIKLLEDDNISYLINIGRVFSKLKEKNKALDVLERALSKSRSSLLRNQIKELIKEIEKMK